MGNPRTVPPWSRTELAQAARREHLTEIGGYDLSKYPDQTPGETESRWKLCKDMGSFLLRFNQALPSSRAWGNTRHNPKGWEDARSC